MVYHFYDYTLDPASREVWHGTRRLALEPKVFQVLLYLLEHRDRMVPKGELLEQCWPETFVSEAALTRCLARLRKAVQPTPTAPPVIETRHRQGYRFVAEVTVLTQAQCPPAPIDTATLQAATHAMAPAPATPAPPVRSVSPTAERRQLTVLFCDVVDSTTLAGQLDPEDFRAVIVRYHATCTTVIEHYGGQVAQYLGDGLLVYFGWPQAHEDDVRRAVHAGVALVAAVQEFGPRFSQDYESRLAARIGMHTGLVVVGTGEEGTPYGQLAVGATPNLAAKLQDSLMARLDQLGPAKGTAQLGATIGREFSYALLQAVTHLDADLVRQDLQQLVAAELLYQRGVGATALYQFKHALIQEAAYASLLRRTRQQYHQHIAQVLEAQFPEMVATQPEVVAHHYTEAGLAAQAIPYWQHAGQHAIERSALPEVIGHLTQGLALVESLPDTPARARHELSLLTTLGLTLIATRGHSVPEVERVYTRARVLCAQVGDNQQLFLVLNGLRRVYYARADVPRAQECAEQLLAVATRQQNPAQLMEAHLALAQIFDVRGELGCARTHYEQCLALYNPDRHRAMPSLYPRDTAVTIYNNFARLLTVLGYLDQALDRVAEACTLARDLAHPFSEAIALLNAAWVSLRCGAVQTAQGQAAAALALCAEHQFALQGARVSVLLGVALATQGHCEEGSRCMQEGLSALRTLRAEVMLPDLLALAIEAHRKSGNLQEGQALLAEALTLIDTTAMRSWAAEFYRLAGEHLLAQASSNVQEAGTYFQRALDLARQQQAKLFELRAAMSLSRLWHQQGQRARARQLLAEVYGWFTEGFETADLQEARALLAALS
jgi:class 3 adenylate cyclase/predicted ATPase